MHQAVVKAFTGQINPVKIRLKTVGYIFVNFGELRFSTVRKSVDIDSIEERYGCRVDGLTKKCNEVYVTPNIVRRIQILCSIDEETTEPLRTWLEENGSHLIKEMVGE